MMINAPKVVRNTEIRQQVVTKYLVPESQRD